MTRSREVIEGVQAQGQDEFVIYSLDVSAWGIIDDATPLTVVAYDSAGDDVTDEVFSGSPYLEGQIIVLPPLGDLTAGEEYRIEIQFVTVDGQTLEAFCMVQAEV